MTGCITAIMLCLLACSQWVYADEWVPFRISGTVRLFDTQGPVQLKQHTAGQLTFTALDEPVKVSAPSTGLKLAFFTREQTNLKIPDEITADSSAQWSISGQIKAGTQAEIIIQPVYKNFFSYLRGSIYTPIVKINGDESNTQHRTHITLKSPARAKKDAFALANKKRVEIAPNPRPGIDPAIALTVQTGYENALTFVMDPVILAAKSDFASKTHDFPTCAHELHRLIEHHKSTSITGQIMPQKTQRAYYGRVTCLYKLALRTQARNDWLALIQACHEALIDKVEYAHPQYFTTWYDALLILTQAAGRQSRLTAALYGDELLKNSWSILYYTHYVKSPPPPGRDLSTEVRRFAKYIGR